MTETAFDREQFDAAYPEGIAHHYWTHARNLIIADQLRARNLRGKKILEIGCGKGVVVQYLRSKGYDCVGVELATVHPDRRVKDYIYTERDAIDLPEAMRNSVEVILLLDVIEHLSEPVSFIQELLKRYPRVTQLILTVPAREELWSNYDEWYQHFRRYDLTMMKDTMVRCHAARIQVQYFNHLLYVPARIMLVLFKKRSVSVASPARFLRAAHWALARLLYADYRIFPKRSRGTSLLCVADIQRG